MLSIISAFLSNRKLRVVLECQPSPIRSINSGVPQGLVLGPTLFLVYINDLPDKVSPNSSNTSRCEVGVSLNNDFESVLKWGNYWLVTFNAKKTKLLSLSRSRDDTFPSIHIGPSTLPEVSDFRLLVLDISTNVSWERYISGIAKSASIRVGCLYRARKFLTPDATLYTCTVCLKKSVTLTISENIPKPQNKFWNFFNCTDTPNPWPKHLFFGTYCIRQLYVP